VDLADLLEQSAGQGVNVYTHGEMLPAHSYPKLRAHPHLAGHFGGPWQNQHFEFRNSAGPFWRRPTVC
jgi:hydroxylamine reductase